MLDHTSSGRHLCSALRCSRSRAGLLRRGNRCAAHPRHRQHGPLSGVSMCTACHQTATAQVARLPRTRLRLGASTNGLRAASCQSERASCQCTLLNPQCFGPSSHTRTEEGGAGSDCIGRHVGCGTWTSTDRQGHGRSTPHKYIVGRCGRCSCCKKCNQQIDDLVQVLLCQTPGPQERPHNTT